MLLQRKYYLDQLKKLINIPIIKVITGQRRVGKSTLLQQFTQKLPVNQVYHCNIEEKQYEIKTDEQLYDLLQTKIECGYRYLILDEIQLIKNREKAINAIHTKYGSKIDIYLTGSNSYLLSSELSTLLTGRYIEIHVWAFVFEEYCDYFHKEKNNDSLISYMQEGGIPSTYLFEDESIKKERIKGLINTIITKDILPKNEIRDINLFNEIRLFVVNNIGNIMNYSSIVSYLKSQGRSVNVQTIGNYLKALESAYLIYECPIYDIQGKKVFDRDRKYYLTDHTLRQFLFSTYDPGYGKILENIVFLEARKRGYSVHVGRIKDKEVDFIIEKNNNKQYIQVCYLLTDEKVIEREFGSLEKINNHHQKIVLSLDPITLNHPSGIKHEQLWNRL